MRLPLIAVVGLTMYGESWDLLILLGGAVIFSGNLLNLWSERGAASKPPKTMPVSRPASDS